MTEETIKSLIERLDAGTATDHVFVRPIAPNISFGNVWPEFPDGDDPIPKGWEFYFIHASEGGPCVAAVFVMDAVDLHVFVKPEYRRKGLMTNALRDVILPHIMLERSEQRVTFESVEARGLIEKVGFDILDDKNARITREKCAQTEFPEIEDLRFTKSRLEAIQRRIGIATTLLRMAKDECSLYFDGDLLDDMEECCELCLPLRGKIGDEWWAKQSQIAE